MPTGYTAGILDGKIKTFKDFAKQCIRAFGAAIHMRDEPLSEPYKPAEPLDYYKEEIEACKKQIKKYENMSDEDILHKKELELKTRISDLEETIEERKATAELLNDMLKQAKLYKPPTDDHQGIKDFMVEQLETTIKRDGDSGYYEEELKNAKKELESLDPAVVRKELLNDIKAELAYYTDKYEKDLKAVEQSNKWAEDFFKSLE